VTADGDRRLATVFGLLGALLIALGGLVELARGVAYLTFGHAGHAFVPLDQALVFLVIALIVGLFSILGGARHEARPIVSGAVLVVLVIVGWLAFGLANGILAILGMLLALVAGVVFLASGR
jgi:hypothetical protein